MRTKLLIILLCFLTLNAMGQGTVTRNKPKQETPAKTKTPARSSVTVSDGVAYNGHYYVDLGLPSGTKWATTNVGATSPSDYGNYYAWGETSTKSTYTWENLKYCLDASGVKFSKYVTDSEYGTVDGKTELELSDDAAHVNWGSGWRMPSLDQLEELKDKCKWTWTTLGGHKGYKVVGTNGNSIFLPAAGCRCQGSLHDVGSRGDYWSRTLYASLGSCACDLYFNSSYVDWGGSYRCCGRSVRAVLAS